MLADDVKAFVQLGFIQADQDGDVARLEEAAGRRQLGDLEAGFHQIIDHVLCIIVLMIASTIFITNFPLY